MAMTVRLPAELDAALERLAAERHTSKHALIIEAADRFTRRADRSSEIDSAVDFVLSHDSELLQRLEDA